MSAEKANAEGKRWLATARGDLETARILLEAHRWAHACFHEQQAGEKALEALWYARDLDPWGHSILRLIQDLKDAHPATHEVVRDLAETAAQLDRFYIPTRYPNGLPDLTPEDAFFESDALRALDLAASIAGRVAQATA
jgi:HEPN domain-containing protein